jgi:hypothetical protein
MEDLKKREAKVSPTGGDLEGATRLLERITFVLSLNLIALERPCVDKKLFYQINITPGCDFQTILRIYLSGMSHHLFTSREKHCCS